MMASNLACRIPGEILRGHGCPRCSEEESVIEHLLESSDGDDLHGLFVCYAHEDAPLVLPWVDRLISAGMAIHYDEGGVLVGRWFDELSRAIDLCAGMIFVVSPRSIASRNCQTELQYALSIGKPVAFAHLEVLDKEPEYDEPVPAPA